MAQKLLVSSNDIRQCKFYVEYLRTKFNSLLLSTSLNSEMAYCSAVNDTLKYHLRNEDERSSFIKEMEQTCKYTLIPMSAFEWIKDNDRCCFWVWGYIRFMHIYQNEIALPTDNELINVSKTPSNSNERFEYIVEMFDRWKYKKKKQFLDEIRNKWSDVYLNNKTPFKWLDKNNTEQCKWAWNYTENYLKNNQRLSYKIVALPHVTPSINTENSLGMYLSVFAAFDLWCELPEAKKLFLININKAWNQQKYRNEMKGKKALNIYIDKKSKEKLDQLSEKRNMKLNKMIEYLIDNEFNNNCE